MLEAYEQYVKDNWNQNGKPWADDELGRLKSLYIMATGLAGETGEVQEHLKKYVRDGYMDVDKLKLELGDVLHYLTRICQQFNLDLQAVAEANMDKLDRRFGRKTQERQDSGC